MSPFGELRSLLQEPASVARGSAITAALRDTSWMQLERTGAFDYLARSLARQGDDGLVGADSWSTLSRLRGGAMLGLAAPHARSYRGFARPAGRIAAELADDTWDNPLCSLDLSGVALDAATLFGLFGSCDLEGLRWLSLRGCGLEHVPAELWRMLPEGLEVLDLGGNGLQGSRVGDQLPMAACWSGLRRLGLSETGVEDGQLALLCRAEVTAPLVALDLSGNPITDVGLAALCASPLMHELHALDVSGTAHTQYGLAGLTWGVAPGQLEHLGLSIRGEWFDVEDTSEVVDAVLGALEGHGLEDLRSLRLQMQWGSRWRASVPLLRGVAEMGWFARLRALDLGGIKPQAFLDARLASHHPSLRELALRFETSAWNLSVRRGF